MNTPAARPPAAAAQAPEPASRPLVDRPAAAAGSATELQAQALVETIERQVAAQRQTLMDSAQAQAAAIRQRAQAKARTRLRRSLQQMRVAESQALQQVQAEIETARRRGASVRARQTLDRAWPALEAAVQRRWQSGPTRERWIDALLVQGQARLPPAGWALRHPAAWNSDDVAALQRALLRHGVAGAQLQADTTLAAGLVLEVGGARLDGTPRALLGDRPLVEAALLAAFETTTAAASDSESENTSATATEAATETVTETATATETATETATKAAPAAAGACGVQP